MRAENENYRPESLRAKSQPIEFLTENGFSIIRPWEIDRMPAPVTGEYRFLVRNPQNAERQIVVQIAREVIAKVELQTCGRVRLDNSFWIVCAERHLANHLWEQGDFPSGDLLLIDELEADDIMSAVQWRSA